MRACLASVFALALGFVPLSAVEAQVSRSVCGAGPYIVSITDDGILPSVSKQMAWLGLDAKLAGCSGFQMACPVRLSTGPADKKAARLEIQKGCAAVKAALLANSLSRNSAISRSLNKETRDAVKVLFPAATSSLPAGKVSIRVNAVSTDD